MNCLPRIATVQASAVTVEGPTFVAARVVISWDKQSATTGTVAVAIVAPGMTDAHTVANSPIDITAADRQHVITGGDLGDIVLTPTSVNSDVKFRVAYFDS